MSELRKFLEQMRAAHKAGRRTVRHGDPSKGLEYNKLATDYKTSRRVLSVDIARTPQIVKEDEHGRLVFIDVQAEAFKVNNMRNMIDYVSSRVKGRGR